MVSSSGSYHLLSAVLTRAADQSTLALASPRPGAPLAIDLPPRSRDLQEPAEKFLQESPGSGKRRCAPAAPAGTGSPSGRFVLRPRGSFST